MRSFAVVVLDVDAEDVLKLTTAEDEKAVEAFAADGADPAFMCAFAFGARTGVWMTLTPSLSRRASKARGNFASRSWIRSRTCRSLSSSSMSRLRACCSIQAVSGLVVIARYSTRRLLMEMNPSTYRRRGQTVSTVKRSQAGIDSPCTRRKLRQECASNTPPLQSRRSRSSRSSPDGISSGRARLGERLHTHRKIDEEQIDLNAELRRRQRAALLQSPLTDFDPSTPSLPSRRGQIPARVWARDGSSGSKGLLGEARVITFADTLAVASPDQETQKPSLRGFLIWAGQGSNLRPWD
jgi:hypothetical protein